MRYDDLDRYDDNEELLKPKASKTLKKDLHKAVVFRDAVDEVQHYFMKGTQNAPRSGAAGVGWVMSYDQKPSESLEKFKERVFKETQVLRAIQVSSLTGKLDV